MYVITLTLISLADYFAMIQSESGTSEVHFAKEKPALLNIKEGHDGVSRQLVDSDCGTIVRPCSPLTATKASLSIAAEPSSTATTTTSLTKVRKRDGKRPGHNSGSEMCEYHQKNFITFLKISQGISLTFWPGKSVKMYVLIHPVQTCGNDTPTSCPETWWSPAHKYCGK